MISVVMIDSRSKTRPDWVNTAINSIKKQLINCELIIVKNLERDKTIGQCWNEGVKLAKNDWVFFMGDDDFLSDTYLFDLCHLAQKSKSPMVTSYMTVFNDNMNEAVPYTEVCTGMYKKEYLEKYPFNEKLTRGIDREYIDKLKLRGDTYSISQYNYGYFYRKHNEYSCAGDISFDLKDIYVIATSSVFVDPIMKGRDAYISNQPFNPLIADRAEIIWCDWGDANAIKVADYECNARKFLRIHSYEAFGEAIKHIDFAKFEKVIFVANHIKEYVERNGKIPNAIVIPNGVDLKKYKLGDKTRNNKIAYVGHLTRKKGIGELLLIAKSLPEYEFYLAGKFQEDDITEYLKQKKPDNVFLDSWQYDLNEWFKDKTYIINTSMRESQGMSIMEGMACGLKPLISDWIGAEDIYDGYVYKDIDGLKALLEGEYNPKEYRQLIEDNYNIDGVLDQIDDLIKIKEIK